MKQSTNSMWGIYAVLILIMGMAFLLRLINVEAFSFWTDEGLTPLRSGYSIPQILRNDAIIQGFVTKDTHPPFYYLIIHFTRQMWGETDFAFRFPSVLAGMLLVPVMYQFGRRLRGLGLGLMVAGLTAVNPLQIWYANEARMYTIFVLLLALASYMLWRALTGAPLVRSLVLYLLLAGLAFYTHYTAVFLIAVQALFWAWLLWQNGQKKLIIGGAVVAALAAIPLIPFTIPRLFSGPEANFFYVNPQTMLQDVVRFFNLGLTVDFSQPAIQLLNLWVAALLILGLYAAKTWKGRAFLLSYLLAVVFGLMAGSLLFKPMYQGVRHIMAGSPAFILLVGWGVVFAWEQTRQNQKIRWGWAVVGGVSLFVILIGSFVSLNNLYNQPEIYAKDDFRALVAQMEAGASSNDVIVYNNAIHLPLHEHYRTRQDVAVTAVPIYPYPASKSAEQDLAQLRHQYDRIWFVTDPPADGRDAQGVTRAWLEENLIQVDETRAHARTTIVESLTFATDPIQVDGLPQTGTPLDEQWPGFPVLHGIELDSDQPVTSATLWFKLFWDTATLLPEAPLHFILQDNSGHKWTTDIQPFAPDTILPQNTSGFVQLPYKLDLPIGLPPSRYTLMAQPLEPNTLTPLVAPQPIATLDIALQNRRNTADWPENQRILFDNGLSLVGWQMPEATVRPGHSLPLTLYWQTDTATDFDDLHYELAIIKPDGTVLTSHVASPSADWLRQWPADTPIMKQTGFYFPPETETGTYQLRWQLRDGENVVVGRPFWRPWSTETITLGEVTVIPWPLETELPTDVIQSDAVFGPIQLYGYRENSSELNQIQLDLIWQAKAKPDGNYFLFVHLIDENGSIVAQTDRVPGNTLRPTGGWREKEVVVDTINLSLPPEISSGAYQLFIGFYDPETGIRLPATNQGDPQANDAVELITVTVP